MSGNVLLIIPNHVLRQLYHTLLETRHDLEITTAKNLTKDVSILTSSDFDIFLLIEERDTQKQIEKFLKLRAKQSHWNKTPALLVATDTKNYAQWLQPFDQVLDPFTHSIGNVETMLVDMLELRMLKKF